MLSAMDGVNLLVSALERGMGSVGANAASRRGGGSCEQCDILIAHHDALVGRHNDLLHELHAARAEAEYFRQGWLDLWSARMLQARSVQSITERPNVQSRRRLAIVRPSPLSPAFSAEPPQRDDAVEEGDAVSPQRTGRRTALAPLGTS